MCPEYPDQHKAEDMPFGFIKQPHDGRMVDWVINQMEKKGFISKKECMKATGTNNPSNLIQRLREKGYHIDTEITKGEDTLWKLKRIPKTRKKE